MRIPEDLNYSADHEWVRLEDGLARTVAWTRENLARIDACITKHAAHMR